MTRIIRLRTFYFRQGFFGLLKRERINRRIYQTRAAARGRKLVFENCLLNGEAYGENDHTLLDSRINEID
jgi:hypothetical protein